MDRIEISATNISIMFSFATSVVLVRRNLATPPQKDHIRNVLLAINNLEDVRTHHSVESQYHISTFVVKSL